MSMKLSVQLLEARNLKPSDRPCQAYAQLKLGHTKRKSSISPSGAQHPYWFEEFLFDVDDLGAELNISIWSQDRLTNVFLGRLRLPVAVIFTAEKQALPSTWYPLQKRSIKSKAPVTGEVRLSISFSGPKLSSTKGLLTHQVSDASSSSSVTSTPEHAHFRNGSTHSLSTADQGDNTSNGNSRSSSATFLYGFVAWISSVLMWLFPNILVAWLSSHVPWLLPITKKNEIDRVESMEEAMEDFFIEDEGLMLPSFFEDDGVCTPSSQEEMPTPLKGGALLSGTYTMSAKALNGILFGPGSQFLKDLIGLQKTTNLVEGPWMTGEHDLPKRVIRYVKAATKLVSSVKATEEQVYSRADDKGFVVNVSASTPDVPYGSTFKVNVQYCIFSGPNTNTGEKTCYLQVSWGLQFLTSTMMKSFIEKGARQGLQESYKQYAQLLEKYAKPQHESLMAEGEAHNLKQPSQERADGVAVLTSKSDWQLAREYVRVCMTLFFIGMVLAHIYSSKSDTKSRFEFWRIDLPDSLCELIIAALLGAQLQSIMGLAKTLLSARH